MPVKSGDIKEARAGSQTPSSSGAQLVGDLASSQQSTGAHLAGASAALVPKLSSSVCVCASRLRGHLETQVWQSGLSVAAASSSSSDGLPELRFSCLSAGEWARLARSSSVSCRVLLQPAKQLTCLGALGKLGAGQERVVLLLRLLQCALAGQPRLGGQVQQRGLVCIQLYLPASVTRAGEREGGWVGVCVCVCMP